MSYHKIFNILIAIIFIAINFLGDTQGFTNIYPKLKNYPLKEGEDAGQPLFLTPYIEKEKFDIARKLATVQHKDMLDVGSYAGYLTVNKKYNSNMFFWFFPAQEMDDEKLINCVKNYRGLYDFSHSQYLNGNYKEKKWDKIGLKVNQPVPACKARWNNIRDNFRKSLKKRLAQDEEKVTQSKKYKYEDQLEFLMPFIKIRDSDDILDSFIGINASVTMDPLASVKNDPGESDDSDAEDSDSTDQENQNQDEVPVTRLKSGQLVKVHDEDNDVPKLPVSLEINKKRKVEDEDLLKYDNSEATSIALVKYLLEQNEKTNQQSTHPVDAFLAGLAPTLKSLSPYHLNIAKSKIFNVVQELEMNQIMNVQPAFENPVTKFFISPSSSPLQSSASPSSSTFIATTSVDLHK